MLRSLGAIVGSSISFSLNIDETKPVGVSDAVYIIFVIIHSSAFFIAMIFIIHPKDVVRKDGTHIAMFNNESHVWQEVKQTVRLMTTRKYLILAPAQLGCEMGLALVSSVNGKYLLFGHPTTRISYSLNEGRVFNLRTRSANNFAYQAIQMFMPGLLVCILDSRFIRSRRHRGLCGIGLMGTISISGCVILMSWLQIKGIDSLTMPGAEDWENPDFGWSMVWFLLFGATYAGYQMCTEYTLSSTTNDPSRLAHVAGMFKFYSTLGMMISFILAGERVPFIGQASLQLS